MNNIVRSTINPKDGAASDINGYVRNVLARFAPGGERFNVPQFIWIELRLAMDGGRRSLPYAPYIMFMIERVTGLRFPKDGIHTVYKIEKTHPAAAATEAARSSHTNEDIPEGSRSRSKRRRSFKKKVGSCSRLFLVTVPMLLREHIRHSLSRGRDVALTFHHLTLFHHRLSLTFLSFQRQSLRVRMRIRPSHSLSATEGTMMIHTCYRPWTAIDRVPGPPQLHRLDVPRAARVLLLSPPPLTVRDMPFGGGRGS
jgi:hypothetical protein